MEECFYCGHRNGAHDPHCPHDNEDAIMLFYRGKDEGRCGATEPSSDDKTFELGFFMGVKSMEEIMNGATGWGY